MVKMFKKIMTKYILLGKWKTFKILKNVLQLRNKITKMDNLICLIFERIK